MHSANEQLKMPEAIAIAGATGGTVGGLLGISAVADRVESAAPVSNGDSRDQLRQALLHFLELDAYLDDQAIP